MATGSKHKSDDAAPEPSAEQVQQIFGQAVVVTLLALIILALSYCYFVQKQNKELNAALAELNNQSRGVQQFEEFYRNFVADLAGYSQQHPDVLQMLLRSGVEVPHNQQQAVPSSDTLPLPPPSQ